MSEFEIRFLGTKSTINTNEPIDEIKKKLAGEHIEPVFNGVDVNENGEIDDGAELDTFKRNLKAQGYEIAGEEGTKKSKKPHQSRSYNQTIQNMALRYGDVDALKNNFEQGDDKLHKVKSGDTLWSIAKKALKDEGLEATNKAINDRISQIAIMNGIKDVNNVNIKKHPTLIVHLTSAGVKKVKASEGQNSATALSGAAQGGKVQGKVQDKVQGKEQDKADKTGDKANGAETQTQVQTQVEPSSITLSKNVNLADEGWTVAEDQSDVKTDGFTDFNKKDNDSVKKYVKTEGEETKVMYQYESKDGGPYYIQANTLEELQTKINTDISKRKEIAKPKEGETQEEAKARKLNNLTLFKESLAAVDYNIDVLKSEIYWLKDDTKFDRTSPEFKAFVDDLIRTRDTEVLTTILKDHEGKNDNALLVNDEQSSKDVAGLYKEIRDKEKAGIRLDKNEVALKSLLKGFDKDMYFVPSDTEKGISAKTLKYDRDGNTFYYAQNANIEIAASTPELFDEFFKKFAEANGKTDEKEKKESLQALFKEYSTTTDKKLAEKLAKYAKELNATQEDLFALIDNNDLSVLSDIDMPKEYKSEADKALVDKVIAKFEETFKNGAIDNANYLKCAFDWLDKRGDVTTGEGEKAQKTTVADFKQQLVESFFTKTVKTEKDDNGKDKEVTTYTFKPNRRPTAEEMAAIIDNGAWGAYLRGPIIDYMEVENDTAGQYTGVIENKLFDHDMKDSDGEAFKAKYEKHIESLTTAEELEAFVKAKTSLYNTNERISNFPFNKVMEKLEALESTETSAVDYGVPAINTKNALISLIASVKEDKVDKKTGKVITNRDILPISDENRIKLVKANIFDGKTMTDNIDLVKVLPKNCKEGDAKEAFEAILKNLFKEGTKVDKEAKTLAYMMNNIDAEYSEEMVNKVIDCIDKMADNEAKAQVIINDNFKTQVWAKLNDEKRQEIGQNLISRYSNISGQNAPKQFNNQSIAYYAVKELGVKLPKGYYVVEEGGTLEKLMVKHLKTYGYSEDEANAYASRCKSYLTKGKLNSLTPKTIVDINNLPWSRFNGYHFGEAMYAEVKGLGSGDIRKILKGEHDTLKIDKGNIVGIIEQFNSHKNDRIMEFLDWEAGPTKDEMNAIPKALLEAAADICKDTEEYKNLEAFVAEQSGGTFDYGHLDAKKMDNLIDELMKKMYETGKNGYSLES